MTDINKVRDELARKQQEYGRPMDRNDEEYKLCGIDFKAGFDAAIAHLSKQSVAFDEKELLKICSFDQRVPRNLADPIEKQYVTIAEWQHQQTALIHEAKLAVAVEALKFYADKVLGMELMFSEKNLCLI